MMNVEAINPLDHVYTNNGSTIMEIKELPYYEEDQYDFSDSKSFNKYISDLERVVRNSIEYRTLINYLKNMEGMNKCSILENVSNANESKVKIEIHHSPLTLYDICVTVFNKRSNSGEDTSINAVAEEIMYLHYIGWVGLIPLSATVHDMVHNQFMFIPTDKIRGNYKAFINAYYNFINPDVLDCIDAAENATKEGLDKKRMEVYNNHRIYVNVDGSYNLPRKNEIKSGIRDHISELKGNNKLKNMCSFVKHKNI